MRLSELSTGRDNNFNLIRAVAAAAVLISHSFALVSGDSLDEPLMRRLRMTLGTVAVDVFFVTSGFLVSASLAARGDLREFLWARALRIYPALVATVVLSVFVLGPAFTDRPLLAYLADRETYVYLVKNSILVANVTYRLPGVFAGNPLPEEVNGSLWTLPFELGMYVALVVAWTLLARGRGDDGRRTMRRATLAFALVLGAWFLQTQYAGAGPQELARLSFMFFTGTAFHALRERIPVSTAFAAPMALLLAVASLDWRVFLPAYAATLAYLLFWLAYVPGGALRAYNRLGDYSYGVYLYAWPVQQAVVALVPDATAWTVTAIAGPVTLALAVASWHLLEKRALRLKERVLRGARLRDAAHAAAAVGSPRRPRRPATDAPRRARGGRGR